MEARYHSTPLKSAPAGGTPPADGFVKVSEGNPTSNEARPGVDTPAVVSGMVLRVPVLANGSGIFVGTFVFCMTAPASYSGDGE